MNLNLTNLELERNQLREQLKESYTSHGKTLLMCDKTIKELRTRVEQLEREIKELKEKYESNK
jgi:polyhydroxyalkanoate synthesis regulator phasin